MAAKRRAEVEGDFVPARFRGNLTPGAAVRAAREMLGWSQYELSLKCRMPQGVISQIENGKLVLGLERAKRIAVAMNLHPAVFLFCNWEREREKISNAS